MRPYPKVSFIIPTLNAAEYLTTCLEAIRNQTYPQNKVEIIIADGGSEDQTLSIAKKYHARVIKNNKILHEPGKSKASKKATGKILFFTDADNVLSHALWLSQMTLPYRKAEKAVGFLPQTVPPADSNSLNRYLGYLFTDPFTWFIYQQAANPQEYHKIYKPIKSTREYILYRFPSNNYPLFGLSQGVGTAITFRRNKKNENDDLLTGIQLMENKNIIAYVPQAGIYHYHVRNVGDYIKKYRWRIKNNLSQQIKGMGYINREKYFNEERKRRKYLFILYSLSLILPFIDAIRFTYKYRDIVMLWHVPACVILASMIIYEKSKLELGFSPHLAKVYGK